MLAPSQRREMLRAYIAGKSSGVLARRYGVHPAYPRWLAWCARNPQQAKQRHRRMA